MALIKRPGMMGYDYGLVSSMDNRSLGKFTDTNHLLSLQMEKPAEYDKAMIDIFTQTSLYADDFLQMINKSTPYYLNTGSDMFTWNIAAPYECAKIVAIPDSTRALTRPGIDGQEFEFVTDKKDFYIHDVVTPHRTQGQDWSIIADPVPYNAGWLYKATLNSQTNPLSDFVNPRWLQEGVLLERINHSVGEFDQELTGLQSPGKKIKMYNTMASGYGIEHKITKWANERTMRDTKGNPLDIIVYRKYKMNDQGQKVTIDQRWGSFIEAEMKMEMLKIRANRFMWAKGGTSRSYGSQQEIKKHPEGVYHQMKNYGNYHPFNRGEFSIAMLRDIFGDLFYRRVSMKDRRVKLYTNEAGIRLFQKANKDDLMAAGLTVIADNRFIQGSGQNMMVSYAFSGFTTMETGQVDVVHLQELDLPHSPAEFGPNKMSAPIFFVFDVSRPDASGGLSNIREVRHQGSPSMTWGYINGRTSHLGPMYGGMSASMSPDYTIWMEDRSDIFIEDLSRTVLLEEIPQI